MGSFFSTRLAVYMCVAPLFIKGGMCILVGHTADYFHPVVWCCTYFMDMKVLFQLRHSLVIYRKLRRTELERHRVIGNSSVVGRMNVDLARLSLIPIIHLKISGREHVMWLLGGPRPVFGSPIEGRQAEHYHYQSAWAHTRRHGLQSTAQQASTVYCTRVRHHTAPQHHPRAHAAQPPPWLHRPHR